MAKLLLLLCLAMTLTEVPCSPLPSPESADTRAVPANQRRRRNYTPTHNYAQVVYSHMANDYGEDGEWKQANCSGVTFNCEEISPLHCTQPGSRFFCSTNTVSNQCVIEFDLYSLSVASLIGADLALYKAQEPGDARYYLIYIIQLFGEHAGDIVAHKSISSQCHGWQVFHLKESFAKYVKQEETAKFRILVSTLSFKQLDCNQISNLFLLTATDLSEASGDRENSEEGELLTPEPNTFHIPQSERIDYVPSLNIFETQAGTLQLFNDNYNRRKRDSVSVSVGVKVSTNTRRCYRAEKMSFLPHSISNRPYSVIRPLQYDIGECQSVQEDKTGDDGQIDDEDQEKWLYSKHVCAPTKYQKILSFILQKSSSQLMIYWLPNVVIDECGWIETSLLTL